jgi:hypothetical protein
MRMARNGMVDSILSDAFGFCEEVQAALHAAGWTVPIEDIFIHAGICYLWMNEKITLVRLIALMTGDHSPSAEPVKSVADADRDEFELNE